MKVLVISVFPPANIADADHGYRVSSQLAEQGLDVHVLTQQGAKVPDNPHLHLYPIMREWSWKEIPRFVKCVRTCAPDVILLIYVGHLYHNRPMMTFAPTLSRLARPKTRFVTQFEHPSGPFASAKPRLGLRLFYKSLRAFLGKGTHWQFGTLLRDSDKIIVLSALHREHLKHAYQNIDEKCVLVPPPVLIRMSPESNALVRRQQREALGVNDDEILLAFLGYFYQGKGVETLLAAMELLSHRRNDVRLILIGGAVQDSSNPSLGYLQQIRDLADAPRIKNSVTFSGGFAQDSDKPSRYLRAADIAVLPFDLGVQLNNSSFAAVAAHGLPVVTTHGKALESPFIHGNNVFLCPPQNPEQMADAINTLIEDTSLRRTLQIGAKQLSQEWFSWETATERLIAVLHSSPMKPTIQAWMPGSVEQ